MVNRVVGMERKFMDSVRYLVAEGYIRVNLQETGMVDGKPMMEYYLAEKGLMELAEEGQMPEELAPPDL